MNPAYYGLLDPSPEGIEKHLSQLIISVLEELQVHIHTSSNTYIYVVQSYHTTCRRGHSEKWMYRDGPADRIA